MPPRPQATSLGGPNIDSVLIYINWGPFEKGDMKKLWLARSHRSESELQGAVYWFTIAITIINTK